MTGGVLFALACAGQLAFTARALRPIGPRLPGWLRAWTALSAGAALGAAVAGGNPPAAAFCAGTLLLLARDWWIRKGGRAARELGAKSAALLTAVTERAREAGAPLPQGVRA